MCSPTTSPENACIDSIMAMQGVKCAVTTRPLTEKEVSFLRSNKKIVNQKRSPLTPSP